MATHKIKAFDLYCGVGGSSRGAWLAGVEPVAALDRWSLAADAYELSFPDARVYNMAAASMSNARLLREVGGIDLLLASPECTSHSVAKGKRRGREDSRSTAFEVVRFAKVLKPRWIVVENVIQMRRWKRYKEWLRGLEALGYHIEIGVLDAQYFGTPQSRRRLFVLCDRLVEPKLPAARAKTRQTAASIFGRGEPPDGWAFSPVKKKRRADATIERARRARRALGAKRPFVMVYYGSDGAGGYQTLRRPLRTVTTLDRFAWVRRNGKGDEMRMLQPPELAAAMGFPAEMPWPEASRRERIKLIGNAVCPRVMRAVVESLISTQPAADHGKAPPIASRTASKTRSRHR